MSSRMDLSLSCVLKKADKGYAADVIDTGLEFTVELLEGEYAISLYHDVNGNNKLDTGLYGIPVEGYGFSNHAKGAMERQVLKNPNFRLPKIRL
jgi:uncharacterized protein (DUF2141 family)